MSHLSSIDRCEKVHSCYNCSERLTCKLSKMFLHYGLKRSSAYVYARALAHLERLWNITPHQMLETPIDDLALMFENLVRRNRATVEIAWKWMNVLVNALKTWLYIHRVIKNRRLFPEIKFPKAQLKTDPMAVKTVETHHVRDMFSMANGREDIVLGFASLMGLRPSLIPVPKVKHIHPHDSELENGKLRFINKPPMILIPRWTCKNKLCEKSPLECDLCKEATKERLTGNKANMIFPSFIPSVIADKIETVLNANGKVTPLTPLTIADNKRDVTYIIRKHYKKIGFKGAPYRLRNYADKLHLELVYKYRNKNLKEFLLGHKPTDISFIYDIKGLSEETRNEWRTQYIQAIETWVNENIFNVATKEQRDQAMLIKRFAESLGVPEDKANEVYTLFERGRMTLAQFQDNLTKITKKVQEEHIKGLVKHVVSEQLPLALESINNKKKAS